MPEYGPPTFGRISLVILQLSRIISWVDLGGMKDREAQTRFVWQGFGLSES